VFALNTGVFGVIKQASARGRSVR